MTDGDLEVVGGAIFLVGWLILSVKGALLLRDEFGWWGIGIALVVVGLLIAIIGQSTYTPRTEYP